MSVLVFVAVMAAVMVVVMAAAMIVVPTVFLGSYEIYRSGTCIVFAAVLAPFFLMAGRNMHINWRGIHVSRFANNGHRLRIIHGGRGRVADVDSTVHAGCHLARNRYADIQIARISQCLTSGERKCSDFLNNVFHDRS